MVAQTHSFEQSVRWVQLAWQKKASALILLHPGELPSKRPTKVSWCPLSEREIDVLQWLAEGLSNIDIARKMSLSPLTVKSHLGRIARRLDVKGDRAGLVSIAIRQGWI